MAIAVASVLSTKERQALKRQAHHLKPVVTVGQAGLTASVLAEVDIALDAHGLIKVKLPGGDRDLRDAMIARIAEDTGADLVDRIGNMAILYRAKVDPEGR